MGLRERLIVVIPASLKQAIAVGIGLLVASIGLQWGGLIVDSPGTLVTGYVAPLAGWIELRGSTVAVIEGFVEEEHLGFAV